MPVLEAPVYEEPVNQRKLGKYERVMLPLMDQPEIWAKIGTYKSDDSAYQACLNLRHGRYQIPGEPEDWEFHSESQSVFARYLAQNKVASKEEDKPHRKSKRK